MNIRFIAIIATILLGASPCRATGKMTLLAKVAKGPIQITLRLNKTKVKVHKSLWYKIELKNIGAKRIPANDWLFRDPWGIYQNSKLAVGIFLEVIDPKGKQMHVRPGGDRVRYEWESKSGETLPFTPQEQSEIDALQARWKKSGMTAQQQSVALSEWTSAPHL